MKLVEIIPKNELDAIQSMIDSHRQNKEFEVSIFSSKETSQDLLTLEKFENLISVLTVVANREKVTPIYSNTLDISFSLKNITNDALTTYRITITDIEQINQYMEMLHQRKNSLVFSVLVGFIHDKGVENKNITIMKKTKHIKSYITLDDVYLRFKLDDEEQLTKNEIAKLSNIVKSYKEEDYNINYRFKERTSFTLEREKNKFTIDLTRVRSSNKINAIENNNMKREIEIEADIKNSKTVLPSILSICEFIIKTVQESNFLITKTTSNAVIAKYKNILNLQDDKNSLYNRNVISLEVQHVVDFLPNKYAITDKADGDHCQLIVVEKGACYILTQNLVVKDIGIMVDKKFIGSILDGELILVKQNKYLFMTFDCLILGDINVKNEEQLFKRLEYADELIQAINKTKFTYEQLDLEKYNVGEFDGKNGMLQYHKQNLLLFYDDIDDALQGKSNNTLFRRKYFIPVYGVKSNEIFKYISMMWNTYSHDNTLKCPYHLDGWVAQPLNEKYVVEKNLVKLFDYKWKPPTRNSIDFYAEFERELGTNKIIVAFDNTFDNTIKNQKYCVVNLFVGSFANGVEKPIPFYPEKSLSQMYVYLDENEIPRSQDGKQINDKTVIECYYDNNLNKPYPFRWIPIETRYDKTESVQKYGQKYGNFVTTAQNIMNSIMNPLLAEDFDVLAKDELFPEMFEKLRSRITLESRVTEQYYAQKDKINTDMRKFHNYVKSNLIYTYFNAYYTFIQNNVFELASGVGGELNKLYYVLAKSSVGIDLDAGNVTECVGRYNNLRKTKPNFPPMSFIRADLSIKLDVESQEKMIGDFTFNNKELLNKYFVNNITLFDALSCQFALHYFFKNSDTWNNFLTTVDTYSREGSFFIVTLFDGDLVREKLKNVSHYEEFYTTATGEKKVLFDIVKRYADEDKKEEFGQTISVHMSWISNEGTYIDEYLVKPDFLINEMAKIQFDLVDTDNFNNQYEMSKRFLQYGAKHDATKNKGTFSDVYKLYGDDEIDIASRSYSFLNRYYVFKKKENNLNEVYDKYYKHKDTDTILRPGKIAKPR